MVGTLDMIALVTGVPTLLFVVLIAMARFEATVAPDVEGEGADVGSIGPGAPVRRGRTREERGRPGVATANADGAGHSRAA